METTLRQNPEYCPDCLKLVFFGPESTGKSVMSKMLADELHAAYVPEYSRWYAEEMRKKGLQLTKQDVLPIARGQMALENQHSKYAKELLICDTDLLETKVYSQQYYNGFCPPELELAAKTNQYDFYFLCYIDTPWEEDGIRDRPLQREDMFRAFEAALIEADRTYVILKGSFEQKLETCRKIIQELKN